VAKPPLGQTGWAATPTYFLKNKLKKMKYVMGAFWGKNVKMVELPQFESLGGLSVTFETLKVKVQMGG
jgi:hypothetical protein